MNIFEVLILTLLGLGLISTVMLSLKMYEYRKDKSVEYKIGKTLDKLKSKRKE